MHDTICHINAATHHQICSRSGNLWHTEYRYNRLVRYVRESHEESTDYTLLPKTDS